jgi:YVTN family beta-propeller protein
VAVIDGEGDSLLATIVVGRNQGWLCYDSVDNWMYCTFSNGRDSLAAIDCATNAVVAKLRAPNGPVGSRGLCYSPENNRVYYTNVSDTVTVIDAATSSVVAAVNVGMHAGSMVWNSAQGRLYVANSGSYISVLRDSGEGVEDSYKPQAASQKPAPTVIRGAIRLAPSTSPTPQAASLLDAAGRKVMDLGPGANEVRSLAPGVYFVRSQGLRIEGFEDSSVTKVVITR